MRRLSTRVAQFLLALELGCPCGLRSVAQSANQPPVVRLTVSPVEERVCDCVVVTYSPIILEADASDPDGEVTRVEFYRNSTKIGEATTSPFTLERVELADGLNSFWAAATDNRGAVTYSWLKTQLPEFTTVLPSGVAWRFLDDGSDQGSAWKEPDFDASRWKSGLAPLGFGGG